MVPLPVIPCVESQHIALLANFCMRWRWNFVCTTTIKSSTWIFCSSSLTPKCNVKSSLWSFLYLLVIGVLGASFRFCIVCISRWPKGENFINPLHSFALIISHATWLVDTVISSLVFPSKSFRLISHGKSFKLMHPLDRKIWHCPYST